MLESEPDRCYICLEECDTKSPCECQMPVHERCLSEAHHVSQRKNCSICHSAIQVKNLRFFPIPAAVYTRDHGNECAKPAVWTFFYLLFIYILFGWVGKLVAYGLGVQIDPEWGAFWTTEHFVAFVICFVLATCIYNSLRRIN